MREKRGCFFSDLHLFTHRTRSHEYDRATARAWADSDLLVLGGDIFDFDWTNLADLESTLEAAEGWLRERLQRRGDRPVRFLAGNHDCHRPFRSRLDRLAAEFSGFEWQPRLMRMGERVFLHGDVLHTRGDVEAFHEKRRQRLENRPRGLLARLLYNGMTACYGHLLVHHLSFPPGRTCDRLLAHLDAIGQGPEQGVREVFFGHTHLRLDGYEHRGCRFYNSGAPIKGLEFEPVWFGVARRPEG